jgi:hypothetical protein
MQGVGGAGQQPRDAATPDARIQPGVSRPSPKALVSEDPAAGDSSEDRATVDEVTVTRVDEVITPVSDEALVKVESVLCPEDYTDSRQRALVENVVQREQEDALIKDFRGRGFTGPSYEFFEMELAAYGSAVLMAWMRRAEIYNQCRDKKRPISGPLPQDYDDRVGLAGLVVATALDRFRDVLRDGTWDPGRGATLKTYFVGACVLAFSNVWDRWHREERRRVGELMHDSLEDSPILVKLLVEPSDEGPEQVAFNRHRLRQVLALMDGDLRWACELISRGHTYKEAAEAIGTSEGALRERLRRIRAKNTTTDRRQDGRS